MSKNEFIKAKSLSVLILNRIQINESILEFWADEDNRNFSYSEFGEQEVVNIYERIQSDLNEDKIILAALNKKLGVTEKTKTNPFTVEAM